MSSPTSRRSNRSSVNGTPRRSQRNSNVPMSDASLPDANGADEQLQSEASQQEQETTPRANARSSQNESQSQAPPTSSPLFFRSSPAGSQSQSQSQGLNVPAGTRGVGASSPLRQQSDAASSQGGRTPRASGAIGGIYLSPPISTSVRLTRLARLFAYSLWYELRCSWSASGRSQGGPQFDWPVCALPKNGTSNWRTPTATRHQFGCPRARR